MIGRLLLLALSALAAALLVPAVHAHSAPLALGVLALLAWLWLVLLHGFAVGLRVRQALRSPDARAPLKRLPNWMHTGLWAELIERMAEQIERPHRAGQTQNERLADFLQALQAAPVGLVLLDPDLRIEWCNQAACTQLGLHMQHDVGQPIVHLVREPGFADYLRRVQSEPLAHAQQTHTLLGAPQRATGHSPLRVQLRVQLQPYGRRQGQRHVLLTHDITTQAEAEALRRDFVANVSHEIRTPLAVLHGLVETLQGTPLSEPERQEVLALMGTQSLRMTRLVQDLLTLSQLEGTPTPGLTHWIDMSAEMQTIERDARALAAHLGNGQIQHTLAWHTPPGLRLAADASELRSALSNLVHNALRYTPLGGRIEVSWQRLESGSAEFAVSDTGPGIAAEHLPRLSERFYRVDSSRSLQTGGTGLGLAITKQVAQRLDGELLITSTLGQGSRFALRLPRERVRLW